MKILILANSDLGLYKFRKELIEELIKNGYEVYLSLPEGDLIKPFEIMGCTFIETPVDRRGINPITDFKLLRRYKDIIKKVNPDLVITYTIKPNIYGGIAALLLRKEYAVNITGLGTAFEKSGVVKNIVVILYRFALSRAKVVFFENNSNRDTLVSSRCCKKEKTVVLNGAGVNTDIYNYQSYPHNHTLKFLFVGRVMKEKGIDELLDAMKRLVSEGKKCALDVVGPLEENYKEKLEECEKEGWLKYLGYQEDVRPFIKECDCFVLPSYHEGMANTNLECASSGRPVITSDIAGCREAVKDKISGYLCKPKNDEDLFSKMNAFCLLSQEQRRQMGVEGRRLMEQVFDKKKVISRTINELFY